MKPLFHIIALAQLLAFGLAGCTGTTVERCIVADAQYVTVEEVSEAQQPTSINSGQDAFASIEFIESPKDMQYSVKWYSNGNLVKEKTKAVPDIHSVLIYKLDGSKVAPGNLRADVLFRNEVIHTQEVDVK